MRCGDRGAVLVLWLPNRMARVELPAIERRGRKRGSDLRGVIRAEEMGPTVGQPNVGMLPQEGHAWTVLPRWYHKPSPTYGEAISRVQPRRPLRRRRSALTQRHPRAARRQETAQVSLPDATPANNQHTVHRPTSLLHSLSVLPVVRRGPAPTRCSARAPKMRT